MNVSVLCARGVQVVSFTLHHTGCTLVWPSTWAKRVPGIVSHFVLYTLYMVDSRPELTDIGPPPL